MRLTVVDKPGKKRVFIRSSQADVAEIQKAMQHIDLDAGTPEQTATPGTTWMDTCARTRLQTSRPFPGAFPSAQKRDDWSVSWSEAPGLGAGGCRLSFDRVDAGLPRPCSGHRSPRACLTPRPSGARSLSR